MIAFANRYAYALIALGLLFLIGVSLIPPHLYDSMPGGQSTISESVVVRFVGSLHLLLFGAAIVLYDSHEIRAIDVVHKVIIVSGTILFSYSSIRRLSAISDMSTVSGFIIAIEAIALIVWAILLFKSFLVFKEVREWIRSRETS